MSYMLISDILKPCFFFDCVLVIVSLVTLKGSLSPAAAFDVKVIESAVQHGHTFLGLVMKMKVTFNDPVKAKCT